MTVWLLGRIRVFYGWQWHSWICIDGSSFHGDVMYQCWAHHALVINQITASIWSSLSAGRFSTVHLSRMLWQYLFCHADIFPTFHRDTRRVPVFMSRQQQANKRKSYKSWTAGNTSHCNIYNTVRGSSNQTNPKQVISAGPLSPLPCHAGVVIPQWS